MTRHNGTKEDEQHKEEQLWNVQQKQSLDVCVEVLRPSQPSWVVS